MFLLTPPSESEIRLFLARQKQSQFSYRETGATGFASPPLPGAAGYTIDHNRIRLGSGESAWNAAVAALRNWQMFNLGWVRLYWPDIPIVEGADIAVLIRHFGFVSLNAARIVYVVNEEGPVKRFGFAYGTLASHAERGEERFSVEWQRKDDSVWYDILAFSQPRALLARLANPLARRLQRRFVRDSKAAMVRAVIESPPPANQPSGGR